MPSIALAWENKSVSIDGQRLYRSTTPIELTNLPPVFTTLPGDANKFMDDSVAVGEKYWYVVEAYLGNRSEFSDVFELEVTNPKLTGPGSKDLVGWNNNKAGFFGEVPVEDLISGDDLASMISLSAGTAQFSNEPWLKFFLDDKILFVAKKTYRYNLSWDDINARNAVYGNRTLTIQGYQFRIRLLKGANNDPATVGAGHDTAGTHRSEWNRLIYNVHQDIPNSQVGDNWVNYSNSDLGMVSDGGAVTWCQETRSGNSSWRVRRGNSESVSYANSGSSSYTGTDRGWRPVLELVP